MTENKIMVKSGSGTALKIGLTAAAAVLVGCLAFSRAFFSAAMVDNFFALELGSVFLLWMRLSPKWSNAAVACSLAFAIGLVDFGARHFAWEWMAWFSFLGLASFFLLLTRWIWENERRLLALACATAFVFAASEFVASNFLEMTSSAHPKTLDLYLLMFDASLGVQPAYIVGRWYAAHSIAHTAALLAYIGLAIPITMVYAGRLVKYGKRALSALMAFVITAPLGLVFYNIFPACGPRNLVGNRFPFAPIPYDLLHRIILESVKTDGPRNSMPSLHLTWTLLAWWYSRGLSRAERIVAFAFLAFTAFATLGMGEHWLADLVVAFPFSLMIRAICAFELPLQDFGRRAAFVVGLGATVVWLILLRYCTEMFWTSPVIPWSLMAATVALTSFRERKLEANRLYASRTADRTEQTLFASAERCQLPPAPELEVQS